HRWVLKVESELGVGVRADFPLRRDLETVRARGEKLLSRLGTCADAKERGRRAGVPYLEVEVAGVSGRPQISAEYNQELMLGTVSGMLEHRAGAGGAVQCGPPQVGADQRELEARDLLAGRDRVYVPSAPLQRPSLRCHRVLPG